MDDVTDSDVAGAAANESSVSLQAAMRIAVRASVVAARRRGVKSGLVVAFKRDIELRSRHVAWLAVVTKTYGVAAFRCPSVYHIT